MLASDVIWDDSFKGPSTTELDHQGVTGTNDNGGPLVPASAFLQNPELASTTRWLRSSRVSPALQAPHRTAVRHRSSHDEGPAAGTELSTSTQTDITVTSTWRSR
jgi:hypothetical protein